MSLFTDDQQKRMDKTDNIITQITTTIEEMQRTIDGMNSKLDLLIARTTHEEKDENKKNRRMTQIGTNP